MSLLASFIAALERTGGERLVLRSGEPPHLLVGETRRDLGTATVSNKALAALTTQILSAEAQKIFAETNSADEPLTLTGTISAASLFVEARRSGSDTSITLRRIPPQPSAPVVNPAPAVAAVEPAPPSVTPPPAPAEPIVAHPKPAEKVPESGKPSEWEPIDLGAPELKVAAVVAVPEPLPQPAAVAPTAEPISAVNVPEPRPEPAVVAPVAGALSPLRRLLRLKPRRAPEPPPESAAVAPAAEPISLAVPEPLPEPVAVAAIEEPISLAVPEPLPEPVAVAAAEEPLTLSVSEPLPESLPEPVAVAAIEEPISLAILEPLPEPVAVAATEEPITLSVSEPLPEPVAVAAIEEPITLSVSEPLPEPVAVAATEEPITLSVSEPLPEPVAVAATEEPITLSVSEPLPEPVAVAATEEPITLSVSEPLPEPVAVAATEEPITLSVSEPLPEPVAVAATEEPITLSVSEPLPEPVAVAATEESSTLSVSEPLPEPVAVAAIDEPITLSVSEPLPEPLPEPVAVAAIEEPISLAVPEPLPEPVVAATEEPITLSVSEPLPEPVAVAATEEPITLSVSEPLPEPVAVAATEEPITLSVSEPLPEPVAVAATEEPITLSVSEPLPEPVAVAATEEPITLSVSEPVAEPATVSPTAGPVRIVAFPQQEPKAAVVEAVPAETVPARRPDTSALDYWIRQAARRDATALYLRGGQAPVMRVREQVEQTGEPLDVLAVEGVTAAFAAHDEAWRSTSEDEWVREYDGIGEVRCQVFTDEIGLGLVVHLSAQHSASTLQTSIPRHVRRACEEEDGIVLVSAEAAGDVLAMVAAVAQWTAERRAGYLISVEPPNGLGHDITGTFVSARRVDGPPEDVAAAIRRAVQQRPDILVIALVSGIAAEEAIRAARPGRLMILGVVAPTAPRALESLLSLVNPHVERQMRQSLAAAFRCGFSYRALRRAGGGRTIVHDALVATREVRAGLDRWDFGALDKLQRSGAGGMRSLDAALAGAVHRREISLRQGAMHAVDCRGFVSLVRQASRDRARMSREERPGGLRAVAGASGTQPL